MSNKSRFKKDYLKYDIHESSDFPNMSEHLTDSNILKSRKTYLRKRKSGSLSVCSENSGSFSAIVEELCPEKNYKCATSITNCSYSKNNYQKDVDSEFCLFSDEATDNNISGSADNLKDDVSSILGTVSSASNYQRTRKNLKNHINNEQNNSEETFKSSLNEENSNSVADANELKSANDFLNPNQATFSVKQSSLLSENSQANHTRINKSDGSANELPQKSTVQMGKPVGFLGFGKANFFENPLINQSMFSLIDLVKKFSVRNNETGAKNAPTSKKIKEECELAPLKKESVANSASSSKINSFDNKTLKSTVSVRKSSKNANELGEKSDVKTPSKSIQKRNIRSFDIIEKSVDMIGCVRNTDIPKKSGAKIPSKAVHSENIKRSVIVFKKFDFKNKFVRNNVKAKIKSSINHTSTNLHLARNETTGKIQSDCDGKRIEKLSSLHSTSQNQFLNNIPTIFAPKPPVSQETTPLFVRSVNTSVADSYSIQNDSQAVLYGNFDDLAVPCSSTIKSSTRTYSNLHLARNGTTGKIQSDCDGKRIEKLSSLHNTSHNQFLNNIPTIFAPKPPVCRETTPLFVRSVNTSVADSHSIQNDNQAVLYGNFDPYSSTIKSSITRTSSNLHLARNGTTGKIQSDCDGKRIQKLSSLHNTSQNQFLNNIPTIFAPKPPISQEMTPLFVRSVNTSVADSHSIQNDNQAVLYGNFYDLAVPCSSALSNNHSSFDANTFLVNPVHHKQKVRTGSLMSHSVSIEQRVNRYFQRTENMCILRKQDMAAEIFSRHLSLQNLTVSKLCNSPQITVVFSDYLNDFVGIPPDYHDDNKGYEFPENFETENLLSVVKDFVHSIIFCIIPKDGPKPLNISYLQIIDAAVHKMSVRENAIVLQVFGKNSSLENSFEKITFKLDDVLTKLDFVALLVIFHEYKSRQITSNI
ncbi:rhoGEF domain-containing protein gxcJ-like [Argiope bruennichi]|uniref:Uncharacterized protein n=1 Tax=Argiope bruennichi TaxID=94029 RepID=A0A8T0FRD6_ARGBR|nr:rhoGEF domain-containing protein gxcJ-like [Argiope bruennichi]XP_055930760.1 rhoGEF domain-containing protein gxcJ-like [Argiope bruennichi]KAF8791273.1 hypothetical protein HNY73_006165 [Argiope bruennichi]